MHKNGERNPKKTRPRAARPVVRQPSLQSMAERTRASWAKRATSLDKIPEGFQDSFKALLGDTRAWPYTLLMPTYEGFIRQENARLVCSLGDNIHVLESAMNGITCASFPIQDISLVEQGEILLYAWVKICGIAGDGVPRSCTLKFNAVTDYMFAPIIDKIRSAAGGLEEADRSRELAKFDYLSRLNFKFMSYARGSLLPGEKVVYTILQPEMRRKTLTVLRWSLSRIISTARLCILTDRELILIREEEQSQFSRDARYGGARCFIPLNKIRSVSLTRREDDLLALSICLAGSDPVDCLFSTSNEREVGLLLDQLDRLLPGHRPACGESTRPGCASRCCTFPKNEVNYR